jgi:hypothetical protein
MDETGLENIMLSEISQTQREQNHMFSFVCGIYPKKKDLKDKEGLLVVWREMKGRGDKAGYGGVVRLMIKQHYIHVWK